MPKQKLDLAAILLQLVSVWQLKPNQKSANVATFHALMVMKMVIDGEKHFSTSNFEQKCTFFFSSSFISFHFFGWKVWRYWTIVSMSDFIQLQQTSVDSSELQFTVRASGCLVDYLWHGCVCFAHWKVTEVFLTPFLLARAAENTQTDYQQNIVAVLNIL